MNNDFTNIINRLDSKGSSAVTLKWAGHVECIRESGINFGYVQGALVADRSDFACRDFEVCVAGFHCFNAVCGVM
jgi:hypothetical protein